MSQEQEEKLRKARHDIGLYTIKELAVMFDCGRQSIDNAINTGQLKYISPNNKTRYVFVSDFLKYSQKKTMLRLETKALPK